MVDVMDYTGSGTDGASLELIGKQVSGVGRKRCADPVVEEEVRAHLIRTEGTQSRAEMNQNTIAEYAERMEADDTFPPLVVYYDDENYWLADGHHRLAAE